MEYKISDQFAGALLLALQKSILNQEDIMPMIKDFVVVINEDNELIVTNPPQLEYDFSSEEEV